MSPTYNSLEDFGMRGIPTMKKLLEDLGAEAQAGVHEATMTAVVDATPEDTSPRKDGVVLKESWLHGLNGRARSTAPRAAELTGGRKSSQVANSAPHAATIDRGRSRLSDGRLGGSAKAPRGMRRPAIRRVQAQAANILRAAIKRAARKVR